MMSGLGHHQRTEQLGEQRKRGFVAPYHSTNLLCEDEQLQPPISPSRETFTYSDPDVAEWKGRNCDPQLT